MIPSELLEPVLAKVIDHALDRFLHTAMSHWDAERLRAMVDTLNLVTIVNQEHGVGVHASIAMMNVKRDLSRAIDACMAIPAQERRAKAQEILQACRPVHSPS